MTWQAIRHDGGYAGIDFDGPTNTMRINWLSVPEDKQGNGIGTILLEKVVEAAEDHNAETITASIASEKGLRRFRKFFGEAAIKPCSETLYPEERRDPTLAVLEYKMPKGIGKSWHVSEFNLAEPPSVAIETLDHRVGDSDSDVPMNTMLFRGDCFLAASIDAMRSRQPDQGQYKVISAGASSGAEVDSVIALHRKRGSADKLVIRGFDINSKAIKAARSASYLLRELMHQPYDDEVARFLEEYGFDVGERIQAESPEGRAIVCREIGSKSLREGCDVEFVQHDLKEELPCEDFDLAFLNNVLYHLDVPASNLVAGNVTAALAEHGLLSVGNEDSFQRVWSATSKQEWIDQFNLRQHQPSNRDHVILSKA